MKTRGEGRERARKMEGKKLGSFQCGWAFIDVGSPSV